MSVPQFMAPKQPGVNVDSIDIMAGLDRLAQIGWSRDKDPRTFMLIQYALQRWARGEEEAAESMAIAKGDAWSDPESKAAAIDLTSWRMVLASAMAAAAPKPEPAAEPKQRLVTTTTTVREMWSEHDQIWVPQESTETVVKSGYPPRQIPDTPRYGHEAGD